MRGVGALAIATVFLTVAVVACPGGRPIPVAPAPEYERPVVTPWDGGVNEEAVDPFAAAAESGWIGGEGSETAPVHAGGSSGAAPERGQAGAAGGSP